MVIITLKWRKTKTLSVTHVHFIQRLKVQLCKSNQKLKRHDMLFVKARISVMKGVTPYSSYLDIRPCSCIEYEIEVITYTKDDERFRTAWTNVFFQLKYCHFQKKNSKTDKMPSEIRPLYIEAMPVLSVITGFHTVRTDLLLLRVIVHHCCRTLCPDYGLLI